MKRGIFVFFIVTVALVLLGCPTPLTPPVKPGLPASTIVFADGTNVSLQIGSGLYTNAVTGIGTGDITYSSGTISTATVDEDSGEVTLLAIGTSVITAVKAASPTHTTVTRTYTLSVTPLPASTIVFANGTNVSRQLGSGPYTNTASGLGSGEITYSSVTESTATVNASSGEVTLLDVGTTVITASKAASPTHTAVTRSYTLTVTAIPVATVVFEDGNTISRQIGSGFYTNAVSGLGSGSITYASDTEATATVDASTGEVTLLAVGTTQINALKAASAGYAEASYSYLLTVTLLPPSTIEFANGIHVFRQLGSGLYINTLSGLGSGAITYSSDTEATATVDAVSGEVMLLAVGTTVITAVKESTPTHAAATRSYTLTVLPIPIAFTNLTANGTSGSVTTTALTLDFDRSPTGLNAADITLTGATKGALSGSGTTRTLAITGITVSDGETISVALSSPSGIDIIPASRTAAVKTMLRMLPVPAGRFQRDATPSNISVISQPYRMSQYEITRAQFLALMGTDPSNATYSSGTSDPVQMTNWYHAIAFCNKLSIAEGLTPVYAVTGANFTTLTYAAIPIASNANWNAASATWTNNGYRLPTEMEWMWAAMGAPANGQGGGTNTTGYTKAFAGSTGSNLIGNYAVFGSGGTEVGRTTTQRSNPVGSKITGGNELGLYDMSGNIWEWCWDWFAAYLTGTQTDYRGATSGTGRVARGGCWGNVAAHCAVASRYINYPNYQDIFFGFRVVRP